MTRATRKILIVDDSEFNLDILDEILGARFELRRAHSGAEALAALAEFAAEIALLDVVMPGMDGYETCRRITSDPRTANTKVILVSAKGSTHERLQGYAVGASDFVVKPFDPDELAAKVDVFLALKTAQDESRAKSDFVAHISHEIRTPMTAILGYSENLRDPSLPAAARQEAIDIIWRNGQHLLELINNILDLSKIESNRLATQRVPCEPMSLLADVVDMLRPRARDCQLSLSAEAVGELPARVLCDRGRVKQILVNLVGNALKFTERGGVRVVARQERQPDREPWLAIDVIDTGIGIDASVIESLGQPFVQADASITRRYGGTGLGLSISRRLARLLGGDIKIASRPGAGSTFTLRVPVGPLEAVPMADATQAASGPRASDRGGELPRIPCRILLAEDGLDNQRLLQFILTKAGADVSIVANGRLAVDAVAAAEKSGHPFDVVLMDMQMPVLDGYSATAELREAGFQRPIVGVTAHAMPEDRQRCMASGCDRFAAKPVDRAALLRTIRELLDAR